MQNSKVVAKEMPSIGLEEEIRSGGEWIRYQKMELRHDKMELRVYHFWHKIFCKIDQCGDHIEVLPKMVKCVLALSLSYADVGSPRALIR